MNQNGFATQQPQTIINSQCATPYQPNNCKTENKIYQHPYVTSKIEMVSDKITDQVRYLDETITDLDNLVYIMSEKLSPILRDRGDEKKEDADSNASKEPNTQLSIEFHFRLKRLQNLNNTVCDILNRIEL